MDFKTGDGKTSVTSSAYRSGWDAVFGKKKRQKPKAKTKKRS